jgi:hypothetical protein
MFLLSSVFSANRASLLYLVIVFLWLAAQHAVLCCGSIVAIAYYGKTSGELSVLVPTITLHTFGSIAAAVP